MKSPQVPAAQVPDDQSLPAANVPRAGDYGIDAPPVVRNLILAGAAGLLLAATIYGLHGAGLSGLVGMLYCTGLFAGLSWLATGLLMIYGSKVRKLRLRDRLLDELALRGDERVLDVGCGRGLMLIGAARRLTSGRASGLDRWQTVDQSGNAPQATVRNAAAEGVSDRIELHTGDARQMQFPDAHFDLVVSTWALHNIPDRRGRAQAVREIARVLKPGGRVLLADIQRSREYAAVLRECGLSSVRHRLASFLFVIPTYRVDGVKRPTYVTPRRPLARAVTCRTGMWVEAEWAASRSVSGAWSSRTQEIAPPMRLNTLRLSFHSGLVLHKY